jgi:putative hydrolase of the HAD superfamily
MAHPGQRQRLIDMITAKSTEMRPIPPPYKARLEAIPGIRHIVFDVYGTLVTSGAGEIGIDRSGPAGRTQAFQLIAERYGDRDLSARRVQDLFFDYIAKIHDERRTIDVPQPDIDIRTVWRYVAEELFTGEFTDESIEEIALTYELAANPVSLMPLAKHVLTTLSASFPLGIVSNAQFYTPLILSTLLGESLERWFDFAIWSYEIGIAKPSRAIFERYVDYCASRFNEATDRPISPGEILYVGNDMRNDIETAGNAGWRTVLFAGDARSLRLRNPNHEDALAIPDAVITSLDQLSEVVPKRPPIERKGRTT